MVVIDREALNQLAEDLPGPDLRRVLRTFEADMRQLSAALAAAAATDDAPLWRRSAHSMAGAAGAVGARGLEQAARVAMTATTPSRGDAASIAALADETLLELARFAASGALGS